jgi:glutamate N-acetyltransferase/amino-acid N-acetyltransferase
MTDAKKMVSVTAQELGVKFANVCVASTGVIGRTLPIDKISAAIPVAVKRLSDSALMSLAKAILTTDKNRKVETAHISVGGKQVTITGLCKGAGMVHPNMATMLCFIMTDADIDKDALKTALKECVQDTFNVITVDGDMSTNDSVILMANGMSGNTVVKKGTRDYKTFRDALRHVTMELAKEIVKDGEGATKFVEIKVTGARTEKDAQKVARTIANSCLVKTSIHGQDPNWGRIASSVGSTMIEYIRPNKVEIHLDGVCMFRNNQFTNPPAGRVSGIYKKANVDILVNLNSGSKSAKMYTCDLSKRYVEINAHYLT